MTRNNPLLTLPPIDVDGDGTDETGKFVLTNVEITTGIRTGYVVGGRGSTVNAIYSDYLGDGQSARQGLYFDLGGGADFIQLKFSQWKGSDDQWGNDSTAGLTQASATGQDPISQIDVLKKYLTVGQIDSRNPATLEYGEYSSSGVYSPKEVAIESPEFSYSPDRPSALSGSITCIVVIDNNQSTDAQNRRNR